MLTVTISPKYQIVIPKEIRQAMRLSPGEKLLVYLYQNRLEFVSIKDTKKMRGFLKGMKIKIEREKDRL